MMASSQVMSTTSPANPDLPRQPSLCPSLSTLLADLQRDNKTESSSPLNLGSMSMDDLLKNIYASPLPVVTSRSDTATLEKPDPHAQFSGALLSREGSFSLPKDVGNKSVDEVWREIVSGTEQRDEGSSGQSLVEMTLEDFLTKAGAVRDEEVRGGGVVVPMGMGTTGYGVDAVINGFQGFGPNQRLSGTTAGGRGKRRAVEEPLLDKATQQKQRRMIKNRESAARSRERKQAYTDELEALVTQLKEENARLVREEAEQKKQRFNQLLENLIPVEEKREPRRVLRRVTSLEW